MANRDHTSPAPLQRDGSRSLVEQLASRYGDRIRQGSLAEGSRLPSVRAGAAQHGVSPSTMVAAYDQLLAAGLVETRPQRGFFVRERRRGVSEAAPALRPPPVDATALIRGMFHPGTAAQPAPGGGTLPAEWLDLALLHGAVRRALAQEAKRTTQAAGLRYGEPAGDPALRELLCRSLGDLGVVCQPGQVVTTMGATQALDIVSRCLLQPGDSVLIDEPGWAVEFARLSRLGVRLLPVPRGPQGPDLAVMQALLEAH
jgi:DNA-binding transcriptional MocR family regulator